MKKMYVDGKLYGVDSGHSSNLIEEILLIWFILLIFMKSNLLCFKFDTDQ